MFGPLLTVLLLLRFCSEEVSSMRTSKLKDTAFEYRVGEYHLRITFKEENILYWEYLAAPNGLTGKNATEQIERTQIRDDILLMSWREADGTQIIDVVDLGRMIMYANFVSATGSRSSSQANLELVQGNLTNGATSVGSDFHAVHHRLLALFFLFILTSTPSRLL